MVSHSLADAGRDVYLYEFQQRLPEKARRFRVVHLPKTIDNDYRGIDFTFGFFTAVDFMAKELLNLRADAMATSGYFIIETMGLTETAAQMLSNPLPPGVRYVEAIAGQKRSLARRSDGELVPPDSQ